MQRSLLCLLLECHDEELEATYREQVKWPLAVPVILARYSILKRRQGLIVLELNTHQPQAHPLCKYRGHAQTDESFLALGLHWCAKSGVGLIPSFGSAQARFHLVQNIIVGWSSRVMFGFVKRRNWSRALDIPPGYRELLVSIVPQIFESRSRYS